MEQKPVNRNMNFNSSDDDSNQTNDTLRRSLFLARDTSHDQQSLREEMENIEKHFEDLAEQLSHCDIKQLFQDLYEWKKRSMNRIRLAVRKAESRLEATEDNIKKLNKSINEQLKEIKRLSLSHKYTKSNISNWNKLIKSYNNTLEDITRTEINFQVVSTSSVIKFESNDATDRIVTEKDVHSEGNDSEEDEHTKLPLNHDNTINEYQVVNPMTSIRSSEQYPYLNISLGVSGSNDSNIEKLFNELKHLVPMDKNGPMSGDCDIQTRQMENFLKQTFSFKNISGEEIVQGVKAFKLDKPLSSMDFEKVIYFPKKRSQESFDMTVKEIHDWQHSYAVYADKSVSGMTKDFLQKALQGQSKFGDEAFRMKFVVRISTCPILMRFDGNVIRRSLAEDWPNRIKLVSVTGVDFAGRIHDLNDITTYISNWKDVYEIDPISNIPVVYNGRDFRRKGKSPKVKLQIDCLQRHLMQMVRLRLSACDREKVEIVVETGIGLGVFSGRSIRIDDEVRALSALATRTVLEQDCSKYKNIKAIVFALPIFESNQKKSVYQAFADEFHKRNYRGSIPVFVADQDMHKLTVAIARRGFMVSELNPADSHGVFGEYWQNRGPAVEEKLALTTVGLLVQHHLINPYVLDPNHYHLINL